MAKKDTVYIDIQTSDGGSMQRVAVSAKKLGIALDDAGVASSNMGQGAKNADRNLKGLSKQSSNSTKNFSKMAQGMTGTLVPAYAVLASNVFAITAAFSFLKEAADFRVMQESQVAFTGATGVGMQSLTRDVQQASGMMLEFKAASEAASIGIASGLGAGQIEELAAGAGNLSKILGRDVTDSFNRLIRGVTKAEPELLDELGITLRLNDAQENYAATLNKSAKDLTNYEKKQAVFAEVQGQLESKYGAVAKATDIQVNAVARLGVEFDTVMKKVKEWTAAIAEPTAEFLTKNIKALTAALALMAIPIIKAIIPGLNEWAAKSQQSALEAGEAYTKAREEIEELERAQEKLKKKAGGKGAAAAAGKAKKGSGLEMLQQGDTETLKKDKRRVSAMLSNAERGLGAVKKMNKRQKADYIAMLRGMQRGHNTTMEKIGMGYRKMTAGASLQFKKMGAQWKATMASMQSWAAKATGKIDKIFRAAGWIGMLVMAYELARSAAQAMGYFKESAEIKELADAFGSIGGDIKTVGEEYKKFQKIQSKLGANSGLQTLEAQGNFFQGITGKITDAAQAMRDFHDGTLMADKGIKDFSAKSANQKRLDELLAKEQDLEGEPTVGTAYAAAYAKKHAPASTGPLGEGEAEELAGLKLMKANYDLWMADKDKLAKANDELSKQMQQSMQVVVNYLEDQSNKKLATAEQERYLNLLKKQQAAQTGAIALTQEEINELTTLGERFAETGRQAGFALMQEKELEKQYTSAIASITKYSTSVSNLQQLMNDQIISLRKLKKERPELGAEVDKSTKTLQGYLNTLDKIANAEIRIAKQRVRDNIAFAKALHGATPLQREQLQISKSIVENNRKIEELNNSIALAQEQNVKKEETQIELLRLQRQELQDQNTLLQEQRDLRFQMQRDAKAALESSLQENISAIIKGEEKSLKDALLNVAKSVTDAMIDTLSKRLTETIMNKMNMETEAQRQARLLEEAHSRGGELVKEDIKEGADEVTSAAKEVEQALKNGVTESGKVMSQALDDAAKRFAEAIRDACAACSCDGKMGDHSPSTATQVTDMIVQAATVAVTGGAGGTGGMPRTVDEEGGRSTADAVTDQITDSAEKKKDQADTPSPLTNGDTGGEEGGEEGGKGVISNFLNNTKSIFTNFGGKLKNLFSGEGTFLSKLGSLFGTGEGGLLNGLGGLFDGLLSDFGGLFQGLPDLLGGLFGGGAGGGIGGFISGLFGMFFANGGIAQGGFRKYARGGIATGPHIGVVGEGKMNEAIVPLPDGKSIPIDMPKGGMGGMQNNNVGVTVNIDNQGNASTNTESDGQDAAMLGERIALVVQEELLNQKRAGGILSPYGVA